MTVSVEAKPRRVREDIILDAFVDLADSMVEDYDPLDFLYRLLDHSIPLTHADAGLVLLDYEGALHLVAASDEDAERIGAFEVSTAYGPGRESFDSGQVVAAPIAVGAAARWPAFISLASRSGWASVVAVPLRLRDCVVGALVLFWSDRDRARPSNEDQHLLQAFADVATIAVLQQRETADLEAVTQHLHVALESRVRIEQAKGMVAQATGRPLGEAFSLIRHYARSNNARLSEVAASVAHGDVAIDNLASR